jgi:hypothetical protein
MATFSFCDEKTLQKDPRCDSITRSSSELILRTHYYYQIKRNSRKEKTLRITQTHAETHLILETKKERIIVFRIAWKNQLSLYLLNVMYIKQSLSMPDSCFESEPTCSDMSEGIKS